MALKELIKNSQYETAYIALMECAEDYLVICAIDKWVNQKLLEEIKSKGADKVSHEFFQILTEELKRLDEADKIQDTI